jgi:hypothetical protein
VTICKASRLAPPSVDGSYLKVSVAGRLNCVPLGPISYIALTDPIGAFGTGVMVKVVSAGRAPAGT